MHEQPAELSAEQKEDIQKRNAELWQEVGKNEVRIQQLEDELRNLPRLCPAAASSISEGATATPFEVAVSRQERQEEQQDFDSELDVSPRIGVEEEAAGRFEELPEPPATRCDATRTCAPATSTRSTDSKGVLWLGWGHLAGPSFFARTLVCHAAAGRAREAAIHAACSPGGTATFHVVCSPGGTVAFVATELFRGEFGNGTTARAGAASLASFHLSLLRVRRKSATQRLACLYSLVGRNDHGDGH